MAAIEARIITQKIITQKEDWMRASPVDERGRINSLAMAFQPLDVSAGLLCIICGLLIREIILNLLFLSATFLFPLLGGGRGEAPETLTVIYHLFKRVF